MKAVFWAGVGTLFPFLMTITGAALVFLLKNQKEDGPCMGFAAGVMSAAVKAVHVVDKCVKKVVDKILEMGGAALVTADHGNADEMIADDGKTPFTQHTTNPVPVILVSNELKNAKLREGGVLADLAPTLLDVMGLKQPAKMTGKSLLIR